MKTHRFLTPHVSRRDFLRSTSVLAGGVAASYLLGGARPTYASALPGEEVKDINLEGVTLTLLGNASQGKSWEHLSNLFHEQTGGTLNVTAVPYTQLVQKQLLDVQSGANQYDIFQYPTQTLGTLAAAGALADLTDWVKANPSLNVEDVPEGLYKSGGWFNDRFYGLTIHALPDLLHYNKEILANHNLNVPTTWEEYRAVAEEVTAKGNGKIYGSAIQAQKDSITILMTYGNRLAGFGGDYFDAHGNPMINSAEAVAALEELKKQLASAMPDPLQTGYQQATSAFLQGKTALHDSWSDVTYTGSDPTQSSIVGKYGVVAIPTGGANKVNKSVWVNPCAFGISAASERQDKAAQFIKWINQTDVNIAVSTTPGGNWPAIKRSVLASAEYRKVNPFADEMINFSFSGPSLVWPTSENTLQVTQDLADQVSAALAGQVSIGDALSTAQKSWEANLKRS